MFKDLLKHGIKLGLIAAGVAVAMEIRDCAAKAQTLKLLHDTNLSVDEALDTLEHPELYNVRGYSAMKTKCIARLAKNAKF